MRTHRWSSLASAASLFALLASLAACSAPAAESTPTASSGACQGGEVWAVQLGVTGGIAGVHHTLEIDILGNLTATDTRTGESRTQTLEAEAMQRIGGMLAGLCPFADPRPLPNCADCFQYTLFLNYGHTMGQVDLNDVSLPDSEYRALIEELLALEAQG